MDETQRNSDMLAVFADVTQEIKYIAINAVIESAHASRIANDLIEQTVNQTMIGLCRLVAQLLAENDLPGDAEALHQLVQSINVEEIYITDGDGVVVLSDNAAMIGWRFPDDPKQQAYPFRQLLKESGAVVCQRIQQRSLDGKYFKYVGVSRLDTPGIVQLGKRAETINHHQREIGAVFGVLSERIQALADMLTEMGKDNRD